MRYKTGIGDRAHVIDTEDGRLLGGCTSAITAMVICSALNSAADDIAALDDWLAKAADSLNAGRGDMDLGHEITEFRRQRQTQK